MKALHLVSAAAAVGCGALLAVLTRPAAPGSVGGASPTVAVAARPHAPANPGSAAAVLKPGELAVHTLTALENNFNSRSECLSKEELAALRHLPDQELRKLLANVGKGWMGGYNRNYLIMNVAINEMIDRDPAAAKEWATALGKDNQLLARNFVTQMAFRDPVTAATWLKDLAGSGAQWQAASLVSTATLKGAQAALEVERICGETPATSLAGGLKNSDFYHARGYEEGFDFQTYVTHSRFTDGIREAASYWASRSPEAAWSGMRDLLPERPGLFSDMAVGIAANQGEAAAAKWAADKLDEMAPESRQAMIAALGDYRALTNSSSDKVRVAPDTHLSELMKALPNDEDRLAFASASFYPQGLNPGDGIAAMLELPTPELRWQAIKANAERLAGTPPDANALDRETGFLIAMAKLGLMSEDSGRRDEINRILRKQP